MNNAPIGLFDSGVGGLTVARAVMDQLPGESLRFIGDTAHSPYGSKSLPDIRRYSFALMDRLVDDGVKMLVIACNTATAAVLDEARERYTNALGIPVVEVIDPAVRRALATTRSGNIGVIGTSATINSGAYARAFERALLPRGGVAQPQLHFKACPRFVEFVESRVTSGAELLAVVHEYLDPLREAGVDTLVLGCTHYPLLTGVISYVMGEDVNLVTSSEETAKDVYRELLNRDILSSPDNVPELHFAATGDSAQFALNARHFLGPVVSEVEQLR